MTNSRVFQGDCLKVMREMKTGTYSGICTDVPYGLAFMGARWDYKIPHTEVFREMLRVTKAGGYLFCFAGSRTYHRMVCNIEDAGWIVKDCMLWIHAEGFPKSHAIDKGIDKKINHERQVIGHRTVQADKWTSEGQKQLAAGVSKYEIPITAPSDRAAPFKGYGTQLKPAYEPICVAMKPTDGTYADNALKHGIAGLNIDGARIPTDEELRRAKGGYKTAYVGGKRVKNFNEFEHNSSAGRWPANVLHDGSEEVIKGLGHAERFFFCAKAGQKEGKKEGNTHPTVKPLPLMRHLLTLLKQPSGNTLILDPYAGSGSTLVAASQLGINCDGIELQPRYVRIIKERLGRQADADFFQNDMTIMKAEAVGAADDPFWKG